MIEVSRQDIVNAAKALATRLGVDTLTCSQFCRETGITRHQVYRLFPEGGMTTVLQEAGLRVRPQDTPLDDDELLSEFHRVVCELGDIPTWRMLDTKAHVSADTIRKRFNGTAGTLQRYQGWLEQYAPDSPFLAELLAKSQREMSTIPILTHSSESKGASPQWSKIDSLEYGAPLNFRGLQHAPINEQGVVFLFGMISYELGFRVEAIQSGFPDCEAKRRVDSARDRWQRIKIEFEFKSSNFCDHGHDPQKCDMIVCWEHDWKECPLEVLEIKSVLDQLDR